MTSALTLFAEHTFEPLFRKITTRIVTNTFLVPSLSVFVVLLAAIGAEHWGHEIIPVKILVPFTMDLWFFTYLFLTCLHFIP